MCVSKVCHVSTMTVSVSSGSSGGGGVSGEKRDTEKREKSPVSTSSSFRSRFHSIAEFRPIRMRFQSRSFSEISDIFSDDVVSRKELEELVDEKKKEPTKVTKAQIKEYGKKYKGQVEEDEKKKRDNVIGPWYRVALEHTQPAHLVTIVAVVYLAFRLFPDSRRSVTQAATLTRLTHLGAVATVFGSQVWMTFVSGLALFMNVPRHVFAQVQQVLFPLYFLSNAALMLVAVVTYTQHHPTHLWDAHQVMQGGILVTCFLVNLGIRLYLAPVLTKLITVKVAIEREAGLGVEVGSSKPGILLNCPHYMRLYRAFRKVHLTIAAGNIVSMAATSLHLYYLATKLCSVQL